MIELNNILNNRRLLKFLFTQEQRVKIYKKILSNLENGLDILTSLKKLQARLKKNKDFKQYIIQDWIRLIDSGKTFPTAVKNWIPNIEYMLIASGDGSSLNRGIEEAINIGGAMKENKKAIIGGLAFPILLNIMLFGLFIGFKLFLAESLMTVIPLDHWPDAGRTLYNFSDFLMNYMLIIVIGLIILSIVVSYSLDKFTGNFRKILDHIPPYSIYKEYQAYSFLTSLSSLMQAGTSVLESLKTIKLGSSIWMGSYIKKMISKMNSGLKPTDSLNVDLFDKELMGDIEDYSDLKDFDEILRILSKENIQRSTESIKIKMNVIKFICIVLVAVSLMLIMYSVYDINMSISDYLAMNGGA